MKDLLFLFVFVSSFISAQNFSKQDTLKGSDTQFRNFWDVKKYELSVEPNFEKKSVSGTNKITFSITNNVSNPTFQIDLQQPMEYKILDSDLKISSEKRDGDFIFIQTNQNF
jgi:hypothetical protein